jgi:hypothetical protein
VSNKVIDVHPIATYLYKPPKHVIFEKYADIVSSHTLHTLYGWSKNIVNLQVDNRRDGYYRSCRLIEHAGLHISRPYYETRTDAIRRLALKCLLIKFGEVRNAHGLTVVIVDRRPYYYLRYTLAVCCFCTFCFSLTQVHTMYKIMFNTVNTETKFWP